MYTSTVYCDNCDTEIPKGENIYKACDLTFCSDYCKHITSDIILKYDPELKKPGKWSLYKNGYNLNDDILLPNTNSSLFYTSCNLKKIQSFSAISIPASPPFIPQYSPRYSPPYSSQSSKSYKAAASPP